MYILSVNGLIIDEQKIDLLKIVMLSLPKELSINSSSLNLGQKDMMKGMIHSHIKDFGKLQANMVTCIIK
jgi:hypothetical protein